MTTIAQALRPFYLNVSEVAAAAGRHPWCSPEKVLASYFHRNHPDLARRALASRSSVSVPLLVQEAVQASFASGSAGALHEESAPEKRLRLLDVTSATIVEKLQPLLDQDKQRLDEACAAAEALVRSKEEDVKAASRASPASPVTSSTTPNPDVATERRGEDDSLQRVAGELQQAVARAESAREEALRHAEAREAVPGAVRQALRSGVDTRRGIRDEPQAIGLLPGFEPSETTSMVYGTYEGREGQVFRFGGVCDGKHTASGGLLEVKNRQRSFKGLPVYEEIQVLAYLYIYKAEVCYFREVLDGVAREDLLVARDDARLHELVDDGLHDFLRLWTRLQLEEAYRVEVLTKYPPQAARRR